MKGFMRTIVEEVEEVRVLVTYLWTGWVLL